MKKRTLAMALVGIVITAPGVSACGGGSSSKSSAAAENTFVLSEFRIVQPTNALHGGQLAIQADNVGTERHELVIVRAADLKALPTKSDGSIDEDKIAETDKVGEIADVGPGSHKSKTFALAPGKYVAFCNIIDTMGGGMMHDSDMGSATGHVHFSAGMHVTFTVS